MYCGFRWSASKTLVVILNKLILGHMRASLPMFWPHIFFQKLSLYPLTSFVIRLYHNEWFHKHHGVRILTNDIFSSKFGPKNYYLVILSSFIHPNFLPKIKEIPSSEVLFMPTSFPIMQYANSEIWLGDMVFWWKLNYLVIWQLKINAPLCFCFNHQLIHIILPHVM